MAVSKVIYGGNTLIDLTGDTVTSSKLLNGYTAHGKDGELINGACTFDANTQDATAMASEILVGKTAYKKGSKLTGIMPNNGSVTGNINTKVGQYTIPQGYHDGSGKVGIASSEQVKIIPTNIREGVTILGVLGTMSGSEDEHPEESKGATPTVEGFTVTPSVGYTCLREVVVKPIPYEEVENDAGGLTVTIA